MRPCSGTALRAEAEFIAQFRQNVDEAVLYLPPTTISIATSIGRFKPMGLHGAPASFMAMSSSAAGPWR